MTRAVVVPNSDPADICVYTRGSTDTARRHWMYWAYRRKRGEDLADMRAVRLRKRRPERIVTAGFQANPDLYRQPATFEVRPLRKVAKGFGNDELPLATWQTIVLNHALNQGWLCHVTAGPAKGWEQLESPGVPTVILLHAIRGMVIFALLKQNRGRVNDIERQWLNGLQELSDRTSDWLLPYRKGDPMPMDGRRVQVYLWRPRDWHDMQMILMGVAA